jgi:hypothetical protein
MLTARVGYELANDYFGVPPGGLRPGVFTAALAG